MATTIEAVIPCDPGCDICRRGDGTHAYGWGGEDQYPHPRERFVEVSLVEIDERGERKIAIVLNQPPNCQGRHRETLLFPLDEGIDRDGAIEREIALVRRIKMTGALETVIPCVPWCDICRTSTMADAWGIGGDDTMPNARERFVRIRFMEIDEAGERKIAIVLNQPPNCQGGHRDTLIFPLDGGLDSDAQQEREIAIIRRI